MKQEDLKGLFDSIEPDDRARQRMLNNILEYRNRRQKVSFIKRINYKVAIPALVLVLVFTGSIAAYNLTYKGLWRSDFTEKGKGSTEEWITGGDTGSSDLSGGLPEDSVAIIQNQFQIENKHYILLSEDMKSDYAFPASVSDSDIGKKITTITTTIDSGLLGCEVYEYLPAGCEAVVAVKINNKYKLFRFFNFESYNNNKDEDAIAYLKLYGINSAQDILKIQFIRYSEEAKLEGRVDVINEIADSDKIAEFYNYYSVLKNSSSEYFESLFNYQPAHDGDTDQISEKKGEVEINPDPGLVPPDLPQDYAETVGTGYADDAVLVEADVKDNPATDRGPNIIYDTEAPMSGSGGTSSAGSAGSVGNALGNSVNIRIYNRHGVYYETVYYPNIGFISRHKVTDEFAGFLNQYTG